MRSLVRFIAILSAAAGLALGVLTATAPAVTAACDPYPSVTSLAPGNPASTDSQVLTSVGVGEFAGEVVADTADTRGRVFVTDGGSNTVVFLNGRERDAKAIHVQGAVSVGQAPIGIALDTSGTLIVANNGDCTVTTINARAETPTVIDTLTLSDHPVRVAVDGVSHRAYVSLFTVNKIAILDLANGHYTVTGEMELPISPNFLYVLPDGRLIVSAVGGTGTTDTGLGSLAVLNGRTSGLPTIVSTGFSASAPYGIAADPAAGVLFVAEAGEDTIGTVKLAGDSTFTRIGTVAGDPAITAAKDRNPFELVFLPQRRELWVTLFPGANDPTTALNIFDVAADGTLTFKRQIPNIGRSWGIAFDPVTGRVFVGERENGRLTVLDGDVARPIALPFVLPGPQNISLKPEDIARSFGITLLVMLLIGAPTPLFNQTLEENLDEIRRMFRLDRLPKRRVSTRFWNSLLGVGAYILAAAVIYSFLDATFPGSDWPIVLISSLVGILVGSAVAILPSERYVRQRFHRHGTVRVAAWTLGLAGICVLLTRLTGTQPGYVYGIIGTFAFALVLSDKDLGRMAFLGGLALLGVAILAWVLRIPVQPAPGQVPQGIGLAVDKVLVAIFVTAVEGLVFGMIPLKFLAGSRVRNWSTIAWLALWGAGIVLFAHVILYPVSDYEPNPSAVGLATIVTTVGIYSAVAVGFWWYFRQRSAKRARSGLGSPTLALATAGAPVDAAIPEPTPLTTHPPQDVEPAPWLPVAPWTEPDPTAAVAATTPDAAATESPPTAAPTPEPTPSQPSTTTRGEKASNTITRR